MRLLLASLFLAPVLCAELRRHGAAFTRDHLRRTRLPALVLAVHMITWTLGARMTAVAQSTLIVNLVPIALPFFLFWIASERINRAEVAGTVLAVLGLLLLSAKDAAGGGGSLAGDAVCLVSMLLFALYLALGPAQPRLPLGLALRDPRVRPGRPRLPRRGAALDPRLRGRIRRANGRSWSASRRFRPCAATRS